MSSHYSPSARRELRTNLRRARRGLTAAERRRAGENAARRLVRLAWFRCARRIAVYLSVGAETPTAELIRLGRRQGKHLFVPVLGAAPAHRLTFCRWTRNGRCVRNRFGIVEPAGTRTMEPRFLDLVVVPLVGFDAHGARLGMGGGFYDRSFEFLRHREHWRKPRLVGFAFDCQRAESLPAAPWDVRLDAVVTERATYMACPHRIENEETACDTG